MAVGLAALLLEVSPVLLFEEGIVSYESIVLRAELNRTSVRL
jgi:hypothetical protein